jgi:c-di-GMP-binding flagellar brake protein YcgR
MICPPGPLTSGFPVAGTLLSSTEESLTLRLESIQPATRRALHGLREADVSFFNPNDASYVFRSKVLALRDLGVAFLVLSHPAALARSQRRSFARIRIDVEIPFRWIPEAKIRDLAAQPEGLAGLIEERSGMLLDLSGGGACLRTELPLEIGDYVQLALPFLPAPLDADPCFASVVRRRPEGAYGLRFEGMPQRSLAAILQFVRSEQFRSQEAEAGGQCAPGVVCGAGGPAKGTVPEVEKPR